MDRRVARRHFFGPAPEGSSGRIAEARRDHPIRDWVVRRGPKAGINPPIPRSLGSPRLESRENRRIFRPLVWLGPEAGSNRRGWEPLVPYDPRAEIHRRLEAPEGLTEPAKTPEGPWHDPSPPEGLEGSAPANQWVGILRLDTARRPRKTAKSMILRLNTARRPG